MRAARDWLIENDALQGLFSLTYMTNPERATRGPLMEVFARVLSAGVKDGVLNLPRPAAPEADVVDPAAEMTLT